MDLWHAHLKSEFIGGRHPVVAYLSATFFRPHLVAIGFLLT